MTSVFAGGSRIAWSPSRKLAMAYVCTRMDNWKRADRLVRAAAEVVDRMTKA